MRSSRNPIVSYAGPSPPRKRESRFSASVWLYLTPVVIALVVCTASLFQGDLSLPGARALLVTEPTRRYGLGLAYGFAALLVLKRPREAIPVLRAGWPYLVLVVYALASAMWSEYPGKVVIGVGHSIGFMLVAVAANIVIRDNPVLLFKAAMTGGLVVVVASLVVVFAFPGRGVMELGDRLRWVGISPSPNVLGAAALITVWAGVSLFIRRPSVGVRARLIVAVGLAVVCLVGSNSITALVIAVGVVVATPVLQVLFKRGFARRVVFTFISAIAVAMTLLVIGLVIPDGGLWKWFLSIVGRSETLTGRLRLWEIAYDAIGEKPLLGWSFDGLQSLIGQSAAPFTQLHNGYLDLLVRGGWVGLLIVAVLVVGAFWKLLRLAAQDVRLAASLAMLLIAVLLHNITEASLARSPNAIWLMFCLLYFVQPRTNSVGGARPKVFGATAPARDLLRPS